MLTYHPLIDTATDAGNCTRFEACVRLQEVCGETSKLESVAPNGIHAWIAAQRNATPKSMPKPSKVSREAANDQPCSYVHFSETLDACTFQATYEARAREVLLIPTHVHSPAIAHGVCVCVCRSTPRPSRRAHTSSAVRLARTQQHQLCLVPEVCTCRATAHASHTSRQCHAH